MRFNWSNGADTLATTLEALQTFRSKRIVDLTHAFHPGIPHASVFGDETRSTEFSVEPGTGTKGSGFLTHRYSFVGQWGTHVDPPAHFVPGRPFLDEIELRHTLLPLIIVDLSRQSSDNPDTTLMVNDIHAWEEQHGTMAAGAFVAMRTDWSHRWPDRALMFNADGSGCFHFPGWSVKALEFLFCERGAVAIGHETTDTDGGAAAFRGVYEAERTALTLGHYQVELLANLDQCPSAGAAIFISFPKPLRGSGFPARAMAILP